MRALQRKKAAHVAKNIDGAGLLGRRRAHGQRMPDQALLCIVHRLQVGHVLGGFNRGHIVVPGLVDDLKLHQAPTLYLGVAEWVKYCAPILSDRSNAA